MVCRIWLLESWRILLTHIYRIIFFLDKLVSRDLVIRKLTDYIGPRIFSFYFSCKLFYIFFYELVCRIWLLESWRILLTHIYRIIFFLDKLVSRDLVIRKLTDYIGPRIFSFYFSCKLFYIFFYELVCRIWLLESWRILLTHIYRIIFFLDKLVSRDLVIRKLTDFINPHISDYIFSW